MSKEKPLVWQEVRQGKQTDTGEVLWKAVPDYQRMRGETPDNNNRNLREYTRDRLRSAGEMPGKRSPDDKSETRTNSDSEAENFVREETLGKEGKPGLITRIVGWFDRRRTEQGFVRLDDPSIEEWRQAEEAQGATENQQATPSADAVSRNDLPTENRASDITSTPFSTEPVGSTDQVVTITTAKWPATSPVNAVTAGGEVPPVAEAPSADGPSDEIPAEKMVPVSAGGPGDDTRGDPVHDLELSDADVAAAGVDAAPGNTDSSSLDAGASSRSTRRSNPYFSFDAPDARDSEVPEPTWRAAPYSRPGVKYSEAELQAIYDSNFPYKEGVTKDWEGMARQFLGIKRTLPDLPKSNSSNDFWTGTPVRHAEMSSSDPNAHLHSDIITDSPDLSGVRDPYGNEPLVPSDLERGPTVEPFASQDGEQGIYIPSLNEGGGQQPAVDAGQSQGN